MIIGSDVDEVLAEMVRSFFEWHNRAYGTSFGVEDLHAYELDRLLGESFEETSARLNAFYGTRYFRNILPVTCAVAGVTVLAQEHQLIAITSRPVNLTEITEYWIDKYFPGKFSSVHVTGLYHLNGNGRKKSEICADEGVRLMIEDSLVFAEELSLAGIPVLLLDKPWNRNGGLPENVQRVRSWSEITDYVQSHAKEMI